MIEVKVYRKNASEVMEIVRELRASGLVQGTDFDFEYKPAHYDNDGWQAITEKLTVFRFYKDKYATLFAIRYSS